MNDWPLALAVLMMIVAAVAILTQKQNIDYLRKQNRDLKEGAEWLLEAHDGGRKGRTWQRGIIEGYTPLRRLREALSGKPEPPRHSPFCNAPVEPCSCYVEKKGNSLFLEGMRSMQGEANS